MTATPTATESAKLIITGYDEDCHCEHCGRALRHGIRISDGRVVGAQCFDKVLTKARKYNGKTYRVGHENIVRYAKIAEFHSLEAGERRFGVGIYQRTFEQA
jgi:hypothetical protein